MTTFDPSEAREDPLAYIGDENDENEYIEAMGHIRDAVERKGYSYERAVRLYGIRGHPAFADFWPVTRYWGMARLVRERLGRPLDD